jgi:hypothetical protein
MGELALKMIDDYEKRIEFLENKLKNTVKILESINQGEIEKARNYLFQYKESTEYDILQALTITFDTGKAVKSVGHKAPVFLKAILESIPFPVFIKDENRKYILVNALEANLFGLPEEFIIGKHDDDFVKSEEEIEIIRESDMEVLDNSQSVELPSQKFSLRDGREYVFRTHKSPFINPITGKINIFGFSVDVTDTVRLKNLRDTFSRWNQPYL